MKCYGCGHSVKRSACRSVSSNPDFKQTDLFCHSCWLARIANGAPVGQHCYRSQLLGLPATLTLEQWMEAKKYFNYRCAYCQRPPKMLVLEHYIPIDLGGGTTADNCVPACQSCNIRKRNLHPDQVTSISKEALERVRVFLASRKLV